MALANISRTDLKRNLPGTKILINLHSDIITHAELAASPTTEAERTTIAGDFVCTVGFKTFEFIPKTGTFGSKKVGSQYELTYEGEIFVPADAEGVTANDQISQLTNSRIVAIISQMNGHKKIMGETKDRPASLVEVDYSTRKSGEDGTVGFMVKFTCISANAAGTIFTGNLTID